VYILYVDQFEADIHLLNYQTMDLPSNPEKSLTNLPIDVEVKSVALGTSTVAFATSIDSDESSQDSLLEGPPIFTKVRTFQILQNTSCSFESNESSGDDKKENYIQQKRRLRQEMEQLDYRNLIMTAEAMIEKHKHKVSSGGCWDNESNSSVISCSLLPNCFRKYGNLTTMDMSCHPNIIVDDDEIDDDVSD
jgi:hypothetical protein